jgi:hypothetical protein
MPTRMNISPAVLFMKIGFHTQESLAEIMDRKIKEQDRTGVAFWGYGGTLCHPIKAVQPFAEQCERRKLRVSVVMPITSSRFSGESTEAREYSVDGVNWQLLPIGIHVIASRYALVMTNLRRCDAEIDLMSYSIAIGPKRGRPLGAYVRYRVDKALAIRNASVSGGQQLRVRLSYIADLVAPYAVLLR